MYSPAYQVLMGLHYQCVVPTQTFWRNGVGICMKQEAIPGA